MKARKTNAQKAQAARRASERRCGAAKVLSPAEKVARRKAHSALIAECLEALETEQGMARFLESRELNPHLTPLACAMVAEQAPGCLVGSMAYWKRAGHRVRKGETARAFTTASGFWPLACFTAEQTDYPPEYLEAAEDELGVIPAGYIAVAAQTLREAFSDAGRKTATLNAWMEAQSV